MGKLRLSLVAAATGVMAVFGVHVFCRRGPFVFDVWPRLARVENCPPRRNAPVEADGGGALTEERVRFVYGFVRRSKSSTGMGRAHWFSGASGGRRSASAAVDGATAIPI